MPEYCGIIWNTNRPHEIVSKKTLNHHLRQREDEILSYETFDDFEDCCDFLNVPVHHTVYADGACRRNGSQMAYGGVGVYHGPNDPRNIARLVDEQPTTNQACELTALSVALNQAIGQFRYRTHNRPIYLRSDSQYAVNCVTKYCDKWEDNGWTNAKGNPVSNAGLIQNILSKIDTLNKTYARKGYNTSVIIEHVPGHQGVRGNEEADSLANRGADMAYNNFFGSSDESDSDSDNY